MLTSTAILAAEDLPRETVDVPEWGGQVCVRTLYAKELDAFEIVQHESKKAGKPINFRAGLVARALCDENGTRLLDDSQADALGNKSARVLDRLYDVAARLSGLGDRDKDAEKNSNGQGGDSTSA